MHVVGELAILHRFQIAPAIFSRSLFAAMVAKTQQLRRLRTKQPVLKKRVRKTRPVLALKPWLVPPGSISVGLVYPGLGASLQGLFRAHIPAKTRFAIDDGAGHAANVYNIDKTVMWPTDYEGDEQARVIMHEKVRPPLCVQAGILRSTIAPPHAIQHWQTQNND